MHAADIHFLKMYILFIILKGGNMMSEIIEKENIENMIYVIDGMEVMFDFNLAGLYEVETKRINEAVKRNPLKFPKKYSWILTDDESKQFLVANCDQKLETRGGRYKNPRVFTEQGVAMLATILKSDKAINMSMAIIDSFVKMRHYINYTNNLLPYNFRVLKDKVNHNSKMIEELFNKFDSMKECKNYLFFEGDYYDSYSLLIDILNRARKEIIIIDNYAGKELLDIIENVDKKVFIVSKNIDAKLKTKYESQYNNVEFINNNSFHDRFIILDGKKIYSCGASFKDFGKKCFTINEITKKEYLNQILNILKLNIN